DPAAAAAEKTPDVTSRPEDAAKLKLVNKVFKALIDDGLYKAFKKENESISQKDVKDAIRDAVNDGNNFEEIMDASRKAQEEMQGQTQEPNERLPDDELEDGRNRGSGAPVVSSDKEEGDDELDSSLDSAGEDIKFKISSWDALQDAITDTKDVLYDKYPDEDENSNNILIDAMGKKVESDVQGGADPIDAWEELLDYIRNNDKRSLELLLLTQGHLVQTNADDDDIDDRHSLSSHESEEDSDDEMNPLDNNMGFESFIQKIDRFKKQLRESSTMGESKYKKQREKLLT
ncbi:hypothetical protein IID24_05565, partial [Patescibacteria group bacterium]|nr:hypothetical protein [Patescibacteria group bacterium]